jgi:multidrug resistance protein
MAKIKNKNQVLLMLSFIMLVNAVAYGTIIPLLYPYAKLFGINEIGLGFLLTSFSLAQFIATPILGRLSDKVGRKPVLLFCLAGTAASLALFASATSVLMLFVARIIDGITGGNISVAQAIIADSTEGEERGKAFGMLGAAFGVGFVAGPAIGGLVSHYFGLTVPFWIGAVMALVGTVLGYFILPETLPVGKRQSSKKPLFEFDKMIKALFTPFVGVILLINLFFSISQNSFYIGLQSFTIDILHLDTAQNGLIFAAFGVINILTLSLGLKFLMERVKSKNKIVVGSLLLASLALIAAPFTHSFWPFLLVTMAYAVTIFPVNPITTGMLSAKTKGEDQGGILGINQAYTSLGQILGPLLAGLVVSRFSVGAAFWLAAGLLVAALCISSALFHPTHNKIDL